MVKLPIYEQQVQPDTAVIPSAPSNTGNPGLVLSSMNKNAEAVQGAASALGDVGQKLYAHAQKLQTLQLKKKNAEFDTQFRQELQDKLYSPEEETVKVNGQDITRPKGIYNRTLKQAEGSRAEFEDYYATTRQKYLSQVSDPDAQLALANSLDNQFLSARDNVYSHEAKQMREDLVNGFKSNISQQIKDAANATDLKSLTESVNNAVDTQKSLNDALGLDPATAKLAEQKTIADVIESSTSAALMKDMSGATSMKLLDAAKDVLDQKDYDELASGIKVKSKKILDETKANAKLGKNINSTKILMEVADGNFSVFNVKELNRMANNGEISNEAATAAIRAIEKPISDYDIKPDDEAFMERVKGIFEASNPADMEKNLIDVLDGFSSGSLSQERMTLLFQAAKGQGSEKATAYRDNFKKIYDWGVDAGVPVTYQSQVAKDYVEGINAGKDPVEAAEVAIKRASASQNEGVGAEAVRVSDNPKDNIGFSDRVMTSPVINTLFEGLSKFSQNRAVKAIGLGQAGMVEGVGGAAKLVGLKDFGEAVSKESKLMQKTFEIKDPKFLDKLGMGASSSLSFFVPGLAVARGVTMLRAAPVIAVALGVSTSSVLESSIEAGGNYEEAKRRGMTDEQAKQVGGVTFWLNMPLLVATNVLGGLFNPEGQAIKKVGKKMTVDRIIKAVAEKGIKPAVAEGTQEGLQQVSSNVAIGDPALKDTRESAIIGAIVGGGLGAVTSIPSGEKQAISDAPKDNTVKDSTGKPLEINTEADKIAQEIAVKKAVVSQAVAGVETIENGGNSKEVALNSRLAANFEIINGFTNFDTKMEAVKDVDRALYEYFLQDGKSKEEAAVLSAQISQQAKQEFIKSNNTEKFRETLVKILQETIPTWRLTAPDTLTVNEAGETAQEVEKNEADKLKQLNILREYEFSRGNTENVKKIDAMIEKQTARMSLQGTKSVESTIAEGEKIVKDGGINGKSLPQEDLDIIKESTVEARQGAARVKQIIKNNLIAIDIPEEQAEASARLWESRALRASKDRGITPMEWYDQNKVDIIRSEDIAPEGALKQGEISPLHAEALKYRSAEEFVNKTINKSKINAFSENGNLIVQTQVTPDDLQKQGLASQKLVDTIIKEKAQYVTPSTLSSGGKALFNSLEKKGILEKVDDETYTARMLRKQPVGTYKVNTDKLESLKTKSQLTAIYNEAHGNQSTDKILFQSEDKTKSPEFKKWFGDSKVVDENGAPKVVYHGTTHDFNAFTKDRANIENHYGKVFYFTDSKSDVEANYAGEGPDLQGRIEQRAERIFQDMFEGKDEPKWNSPAYAKAMEKARSMAKKELKGTADGRIIESYLALENPVILTGKNETRFEINYDENTGEESGSGLELYDAVLSAADDRGIDGQEIWGDVMSKIESSDFTASEFEEALRSSEKVMYIEDENGGLASNDFISDIYSNAGFDGIIMDADTAFGTKRKIGKKMTMDEGTKHYIAFDSTQIKSVNNEGTFDPNNPNIFLQSDARGWVDFTNTEKRTIVLSAKADASTFMHETAHIWLEDIKRAGNKEWKEVKNWLGIKGETITRDQHEAFARGLEKYLGEGKAPNPKLTSVFEKFKAWIKGIYSSLDKLNVDLSPEVARMFDNMFEAPYVSQEEQGGDLLEKSQRQSGQEEVLTSPDVTTTGAGADIKLPATRLHQEALKYKTAEEFVKAQGKLSPQDYVKNKFGKIDGELVVNRGVGTVQIDTINLENKGQGQGTKIVDALKEYADIRGERLSVPKPYNQKFWVKQGFIEQGDGSMKYDPKNNAKSQLTAIWNEAHGVGATAVKTDTAVPGETPASQPIKRVMPTGKKKESAAYQRALERYSEELKNQPEATYTTIGIADQMARAVKFVDENPKLAKKIAYGIEPAPAGLRESAVSIAYNEKMYQEGNMKEFGKSYRSRSLRQTARGQEIVLERAAAVNLNHPLYFARQVIEARTAQIGKKLFEISKENKPDAPAKRAYKEINEKASRLKKEIVDTKTLDIAEAQKIIDSLIC